MALIVHIIEILVKQHKRRLLRGIILLVLPYTLFLCISSYGLHEYFGNKGIPAITSAGKRTNSIVLPYDPIPVSDLKFLTEYNRATIVPCVYVNLQNIYLYATFSRIYFSVFIVPDDFFTSHLSTWLDEGNLPSSTKKECLLGHQAANYWQLKPGNIISFSLFPEFHFSKGNETLSKDYQFTVSGTLSDNTRFQLFDGAVFIPYSAIADTQKYNLLWNSIFCYFDDDKTYAELSNIIPIKGLSLLIQRPPIMRSGIVLYQLYLINALIGK